MGDESLDPTSFATYPDRYGVFAWWPDDRKLAGEGEQWLHPYDEVLAADYLPSDRVWQRFRGQGMFDLYCQGAIRFRAQPRMWIEVEYEGYWIGDFVELLSQQGERDPFVAEISEVRWNRQTRELEYLLNRAGHAMTQRFTCSEFRSATAIQDKDVAGWRPPQLNPREDIRLKPDESDPSWIDLEPL
jgi:hypothetical protein